MDSITDELRQYLDREKIRDCIARLARGEDRRDAAAITESFWPDADTDYGVFAGDFAAYLAWVVPGSPAVPVTQHFLGQSVMELDGPRALVETQVMAYHRIETGGAARDVSFGGRYLDRMQQRDRQWRIAQRTMLYDWVQDFGASADWTQGIMGTPFSAPHFSGRAHGDFSVAFFEQHQNR